MRSSLRSPSRENMATPAKVTKAEGENNHENADEQAGNVNNANYEQATSLE